MHSSMNLPSRWTFCFTTIVTSVSSHLIPAAPVVIAPVAVHPPSCVSFPGLRDKVPLAKWLQTIDISALMGLEAGSPKPGAGRTVLPPGVGDPSLPLPSFWWWLVVLGS